MLGNFFRKSTDHKLLLNKKQHFEIDSAASSEGQGTHKQFSPFEAALPIFKTFVEKIWEEINKNKGECYQCKYTTFLKSSVLKIYVR
jgi:hypothetical protein